MSRRAPLVRHINMLPIEPHGTTQAFFRALEDADDMVHVRDERDELSCRCDELSCRCDELTTLVGLIKQLHRQGAKYSMPWCFECRTEWPCPTMRLIGEK